jgi:hypothetical protein
MRTKQTLAFWQSEMHYIAHAWPSNAHQFNGEAACFNRYIDMQANAAESDGFDDIAFTIRGFREFLPS